MPRGTWLVGLVLLACGPSAAPEPEPEPRAEAPLDPACADALANVPGALVLPAGVARDPRDASELAATWTLPQGVTFAVQAPTVREGRLALRGELVNGTSDAQTVLLTEAGVGFFSATLVDSGLVRRPVPPPDPSLTPRPALFPEPHAFTLAPGARWPLETDVVVSCWEPAPGRSVTAHWWLHVQGASLDGELRVAL